MIGQFFGPLEDKNTWGGVLLELPASEKFSGLFGTCFVISVWNLAYTFSRWCHTSSSSFILIWTLWPTLQPFICIHGLKRYIEASDLVHTQIVNVLTPTDYCHAWAIFGPMRDKNTRKGGVSRAPSQQHVRFEFHHNQVSASEEFSGLFF